MKLGPVSASNTPNIRVWGNTLPGFGWPWTLTRVTDDFKRLYPSELAAVWGEAMWTAWDLW